MKTESAIQQSIVNYFHNNYCLKHHNPRCCIFSCPNELAGNNKITTIKAKTTGLMPGVSDLIVVTPEEVIFCEVKTEIGRQSDRQKEFEQIVSDMGYRYILVRSLEQFKSLI